MPHMHVYTYICIYKYWYSLDKEIPSLCNSGTYSPMIKQNDTGNNIKTIIFPSSSFLISQLSLL